jgi:hypothetical protein
MKLPKIPLLMKSHRLRRRRSHVLSPNTIKLGYETQPKTNETSNETQYQKTMNQRQDFKLKTMTKLQRIRI